MCIWTMNDAKYLVKLLLSQLNKDNNHIDIIKLSISLLLYTLSKMETLIAQNMINDTLGMCEVALLDWVKHGDVIGGRFFGYKVENKMRLLYGSVELKVSYPATVLSVIMSISFCSCGEIFSHLTSPTTRRLPIFGMPLLHE